MALNNNTTVAGITNLKIPKFLLKLKENHYINRKESFEW